MGLKSPKVIRRREGKGERGGSKHKKKFIHIYSELFLIYFQIIFERRRKRGCPSRPSKDGSKTFFLIQFNFLKSPNRLRILTHFLPYIFRPKFYFILWPLGLCGGCGLSERERKEGNCLGCDRVPDFSTFPKKIRVTFFLFSSQIRSP